MPFSRFPAGLAWLFIHILYLAGFRNRVAVLFPWTWPYVTFNKGRLIHAQLPSRAAPAGVKEI